MNEALERRKIRFGDGLLPTFPLPFFVLSPELARWKQQSEHLVSAVEQIAQEALTDDSLYSALGLRPDAKPFLEIDPGYRRVTMLSRPDALITQDGVVFVEFNCDSPAMMAFSDAVTECLLEIDLLSRFRDRIRSEQMTLQLLETLLGCYREYGGKVWPPTVAITDWPGQKTRYEHQEIARVFEQAGYPTVVCDPRAFQKVDGRLEVEGRTIHLVYRRALFLELLDRQSEVGALLSAYRDGTICMVNSLRSYLASSKMLFAHLSDNPSLLPDRTVAQTIRVTAQNHGQLRQDKDRWVLKRAESHGGEHVLLPNLAEESHWAQAWEDARSSTWVAQRYHSVPTMTVRRSHQNDLISERKYFNWNPFLFAGRYAGGIARASETPLISITRGGGLLPTISYEKATRESR